MKKKIVAIISVMLVAILGVTAFAACGNKEKDINVIARTESSGTRDAFESVIADAAGNKLADTNMISTAEELGSTDAVKVKVASNKTAIGYISLGSLDSSVKAVQLNGITASATTVSDGSYKLWRPFVIVTTRQAAMKDAAADFLTYIQSSDVQSVINNDYVSIRTGTAYSAPSAAFTNATVIIRGSTSVEPLMRELIDDYKAINGFTSAVTFDIQCTGSGDGRKAAKNDTTGTVIGMSSSTINSTDAPSLNQIELARDAVVIIVNNANTITNMTVEQVYSIYTGAVTKFSQLA